MKFFLRLIILTILSIFTLSYANANNLPYCSLNSIWKHAAYKGVHSSYFENIDSFINEGYCGIELDIIYDEKEKLIYISHNPILSSETKKKYSLDNLDKVIKDKNIYIWLDWKNTKVSDLSKGLKIIKNSIKEYLSNENSLVFIETPYVTHNEFLNLINTNERITTLNWLSYKSKKKSSVEKIKNFFRITRAWLYVCFFQDKWVSSHDIDILRLCQDQRKVKSIFIFTINELQKAEEAFSMGANVILSDSLK